MSSNPVYRNHFVLRKGDYQRGLLSGLYQCAANPDLTLDPVTENKFEVFMGCISLVDPDLHWDKHHKIRDKKAVREKIESPETMLYLLMDAMESVGFTVVTDVNEAAMDRYFSPDDNAIEIDYLAMYEGEEGKGRGKGYFEALFAMLYMQYDAVYFSQHSTNAPTLERFYTDKMGMTLIDREDIPDFRVD